MSSIASSVRRAVRDRIAVVVTLAALLSSAPASGQTTRIDVGPGNVAANGPSHNPVVSFDGRYTAFVSSASNLVAGDTDGFFDFFRYDRQTGELIRGDAAPALGAGEFPSLVAISHDGRRLLFNDLRSDWVAGDTNQAFDAFLYDFTTGAVERVSVASAGAQANNGSFATGMSADGRYVAFESRATNLAPPALDNGPVQDVFVRDVTLGETHLVSRGYGGVPANGESGGAAISPDGDWVAFATGAANLLSTADANGRGDVYVVHWRTSVAVRVARDAVEPDQETLAASVSWNGALVAVDSRASNLVAGEASQGWNSFVWDRLSGAIRRVPLPWQTPTYSYSEIALARLSLNGRYLSRVRTNPAWVRTLLHDDRTTGQTTTVAFDVNGPFGMSVDGRVVVYNRDAQIFLAALNVPSDGLLPTGDADMDGLPNGWEAQFGLDPEASAGDDGPDGDPDHDGVTNASELIAGSHPRGAITRYLAEGAQSGFFFTRLALLNYGTTPATVQARFMRDDAVTFTELLVIPPRSRRTIHARAVAGLQDRSFSTTIESDVAIVVDRTLTWDATGYGSHSETSLTAPSTTWYLAEGSTGGDFNLFYLLENPNATLTDVTVRYVRPAPAAPIVRTYGLPPLSRTTIYVDDADVGLASTDVSGVFEATQPILVERAMYLNRPGQPFGAGHGASAVPAPATHWFLAEGATGGYFETFLLLLNPAATAANCEVRYLTQTGAQYSKPYVLPPNSRTTVWVDVEEIPGLGRVMANTAFSTVVASTNGVPIVAERAMWWPDGAWHEAHASAGAVTAGPRWALADGESGGPRDTRTYFLIANTSPVIGDVLVTLFFEDGTRSQRIFPIGASTRFNVDVRSEFVFTEGRPYGALIESIGPTPLDLVVERASYSSVAGVMWAAGSNALATPVP